MDLKDFKIKDKNNDNIGMEENINNENIISESKNKLKSYFNKYCDFIGVENIISKSKNKLKSYFNKYCDFIGVENEGLKRLLIVGIISTTLLSIGIVTIPFLIKVYLLSLFIQLINWIIEGFNK